MNRSPYFKTMLDSIHFPRFLYQATHPAAEKTRRVSRHERAHARADVIGRLATAQTTAFDHAVDVRPTTTSLEADGQASFEPGQASPEPEHVTREDQN